ncbi:MAG TPA: G1 family glutamic endopeptidase [Candidatus Acidoferrum sp.]|nr:G1 family glutamic endopeptidase [Candidatus Acidoferrum sp.]
MPTKTVGKYKIRTFEVVSPGFDPLQASPSTLLHHGFPRLPDQKKEPKVFARWTRAMTLYRDLRFTHLAPEFQEMPNVDHNTDDQSGAPLADGSRRSFNWCGAVVFVDPTKDKFNTVIGQWTVPNAYRPNPDTTHNYFSSAWIGIDGTSNLVSSSIDVLQVGTTTELVDYQLQCFAFYQWYPLPRVKVTNLAVSPGDVVNLAICITDYFADPTPTAFCSFGNLTSRLYTSFEISGPVTPFPVRPLAIGNCAEAVVERPSLRSVGIDYRQKLPRYGEVFFDEVMAATANGVNFELGTGAPINMLEDDGTTVISKAEKIDPDSIRVSYTGP